MEEILKKLNHFFAELSAWLLSIIMFLFALNLIVRFLGFPLEGLVETGMFTFIAVVFLGISHCEELDNHINVGFLLTKLPEKTHSRLEIFNYSVVAIVSVFITYAVFLSALESIVRKEAMSGTIPLPLFPVKTAIFIGSLIFLFQVLYKLFVLIKHR